PHGRRVDDRRNARIPCIAPIVNAHPAGEPPAAAPRAPHAMRRIAYAALMVAVGLTGAYAESIPNFELLTLVGFASGALLGARLGAGVAALTMLVFSLLNPYGAAPPLVTASQVIGAALSGVAGAWCIGVSRHPVVTRVIVLGLVGAVLTLVFDLLTNLASGV